MPIKMNWRLCALSMSVLLAACASPQTSVVTLPPAPKPTVPAELMAPLPAPLHFQQRLNAIFAPPPAMPTK